MKSSWPSLRSSIAALGIVVPAAVAGCSGAETSTIDPAPEAGGHQALAQYVMHVQPGQRKVSLYRLSQKAVDLVDARGPGALPQAVTDAMLSQDGVPGSNSGSTTNNTVELVTSDTNIWVDDAVNCGTAASFCADVTLNSFWTTTLNFAYAQVTAVIDGSGNPLSGHGPISAGPYTTDAAPSGASGGVGGWLHTSDSLFTSQFAGKPTGAMLPYGYNGGGAANGGTRRWVFANPDEADTYIQLKVWGTTTYTNYGLSTASNSANDACAIGSGDTVLNMLRNGIIQFPQPLHTNSTYQVGLPFPFTHYGTTYTTANSISLDKWGNFTFGAAPDTSGKNSTLPNAAAPHPAVFPWWDNLVWPSSIPAGTAGLCAKQTGTAPNRKAILTWKKVGTHGTKGPFMTIHATLNEGSDQIWFNYTNSIPGTGPAWSANVGTQNEGGTVGVSQTFNAFPAVTSYVLTPKP